VSDEERRLGEARARELDASVELADLTWDRAINLLHEQEGMQDFLPDGVHALDPRNGDATLFNESRARRPHDNRPASATRGDQSCIICSGRTTSIIDRSPLSRGFTFVNENLYPIVHPESRRNQTHGARTLGQPSVGLHFLQWTSSYHDHDWPELEPEDRFRVLDRLAALEQRLLSIPGYPADERYVSIIKNVGRLVGGSLDHPHQQVVLSNAIPRRVRENARFRERTDSPFAEFMLAENPLELTVTSFATGRFMVPYFMRRPYNLFYVLEDAGPSHLFETSTRQRRDLGNALALGMKLTLAGLRAAGREEAYNVVFHTGPGAGIYLEFLPLTQEEGGFEKLGLSACQSSPFAAAETLRGAL